MRNHILEISESIKEKDLAVLCGAGISKNSGLPLANELKRYILEKLPIDKKDIAEIMASNFPFEAFIETISKNTDISKILDVFEDGEPNTNHILIAKLAKKGYLKTIFTTNFDLLIERALEKEGLKEGKDFNVYCDEDQFSEVDFDNLNKISIFKIHGSADNRDSIRLTLKGVASKTLSDKRMKVILYLFSIGRHKKVLILGYSCSDEFDITPQLQSIEENQKEIIFIEHCKKRGKIQVLGINEGKNPFKTFPGKRIKCNTDHIIKYLWNSFWGIMEKHKDVGFKPEWETHIDDWGKEVEESKGLEWAIVGIIFYKISNFNKAIEFHEKSLKIAKAKGNRAVESKCYRNLGAAYYQLGNYNKGMEFYKASLKVFKDIGDRKGESTCYNGLGYGHYFFKNFKKAVEFHEKCLEIAKDIDIRSGESACYTSLGNVYHALGDFNKEIEFYEKSLKIDIDVGDKAGESANYTNLGKVHHSLGDFKKAIEFYEKSLKIAKAMGNRAVETTCYNGLGRGYYCLEDFSKAIEYYLKSEENLKETIHIQYLKATYKNLVLVYEKSGDYENAGKYKKLANFR